MSRYRGYAEVTLAMALIDASGAALHNNMADVTLAFDIPTPPMPRDYTDAESREIINTNISTVLASIQAFFAMNGVKCLGQVDEPMAESGHMVGEALSVPVRVRVTPVGPLS